MSRDLESKRSVSNCNTLTVGEIRDFLKGLPDDLPVFTPGDTIQGNVWLHEIKPIMCIRMKRRRDTKVAQRPCSETAGCEKCLVIY